VKKLWDLLEILTQAISGVEERDLRNSGIGTQFYAIKSEMLLR